MSGKEVAVDGLPDGPVLVDAEAFVPIDATYPSASKDDLLRLWRHAPNAAAKLRLLDPLLATLGSSERDALVREEPSARLKVRLVQFANDPALLLALSGDADERIGEAALTRMGAVPENGVLRAHLAEVWKDRNAQPDLRLSALRSLYALTKDPALVEDAWKTPRFDAGYQTWALQTWAGNQPDHAREAALVALKDGSPEPVRLTAIRILGRVKDKPGERTVYEALAAMIDERSNSPLRAAIGALGDYGDPAAIPLLEKRREHGLHFVRGDVDAALSRLKR